MSCRSTSRSLCLSLPLAFTIAAGCSFTPSNASTMRPTGTISGLITDQSTTKSVGFAAVQVIGTTLGTRADSGGHYAILNVPAGTFTLRVTHLGYDTMQQAGVEVRPGQATTVDFALKESAVRGNELAAKVESRISHFSAPGTYSGATVGRPGPLPASTVDEVLSLDVGFAKQGDPLHVQGGRSAFESEYGNAQPTEDPLAHLRTGAPFTTEEYTSLPENRFLDVVQNPLSTFSIDVDAGSYSNTRRFLTGRQLPPKDAIRIEELINYFDYDYPQPDEEHPFSVSVEQSTCPWQPEHRLLHIGLQGRRSALKDMPPSNLVFLIDVSGSMQPENKLPLVKQALRLLVEGLRPKDRVAMVVYAGASGLVLPSTPGSDKAAILKALDRLEAGGTTAGAAGIRQAYEVAREHFIKGGNNRIILATDGDFNVGVSSTGDLVRLIEEKRKEGVFLSILGFGMGNLKDSRLEQLADKGNGNYAYIDNIREARKVFVTELTSTLFTIAKDVKLQIEFNPARIASYRLIGYENRLLAKEDFNNDSVDSGELGAGHTVTALYELIPVGAPPSSDVDSLRYQMVGVTPGALFSTEALTLKLRYKEPDGDTSKLLAVHVADAPVELAASTDDFRFAAAVAEFGMLLRGSNNCAQANWEQVLDLANHSVGADAGGFRGEFLELASVARTLTKLQASR